MKFQQIIFALIRIIQILISLKFTLLNIIPKSLVTLQFLKFLIVQIKAYIQGFHMRYQSFLSHWYPNSYSWFSDSMDIPFVLLTTVHFFNSINGFISSVARVILHHNISWNLISILDCAQPTMIGDGYCNDESNNPECVYDGGDCCGSCINTDYCTNCTCIGDTFGNSFPNALVGDAFCNDEMNNPQCS